MLLAAVLISLIFGGFAGAIVGGGATYLVMTMQGARQASVQQTSLPPAAVANTEPVAAQGGGNSVVDVASEVGPAVVTVINKMQAQPDPWGFGTTAPEASGSGVIVDARGYIVTNYHVVESAANLNVIFQDGTSKPAQLVGQDYPFSDLAVIKVDGSGYPYATLGDSDALRVGEQVVAIGSALGDFRNTVTTGIVSAVGRSLQVDQDTVLEGLIQTDAAINHGNSGGPLVNLSGQVIGINTAIIRGTGLSGDVAEGLGFSIPSNTVRYVVDQLIASGKVARPYLGVRTVTVTQSLAAYYGLPVDHGLYITEVVRGGPAENAGIQKDDIVVQIGDYAIDENHPLINVLSHFQSGQTVKVELNRGGKSMTVDAALGERP
jgi:2-alkenal reductase